VSAAGDGLTVRNHLHAGGKLPGIVQGFAEFPYILILYNYAYTIYNDFNTIFVHLLQPGTGAYHTFRGGFYRPLRILPLTDITELLRSHKNKE